MLHVLPVLLAGNVLLLHRHGPHGGAAREVRGPVPLASPLLRIGRVLIFGEIALAMVILSQNRNVLILIAGIGFARGLRRAEAATAVA
jgi:hypothetical protein